VYFFDLQASFGCFVNMYNASNLNSLGHSYVGSLFTSEA